MDIPTTIKTNPELARVTVIDAFKKAGASATRTAVACGVSVWTFGRWVTVLGLGPALDEMRVRAKVEGWAAKDDRGKRGPDVETRKSRKAADARRKRKAK